MSPKTKKTLSAIVLVVLGVGIGRYMTPAKVIEVEKVVTKEGKKTTTEEVEITKPDGTVIKKKKDIVEVKKEVQKDTSKTVIKNEPQWMASAMVGKDTSWETTAGAAVQRRILGNAWGGVYVIPMGTKAQGGFIFTYEF